MHKYNQTKYDKLYNGNLYFEEYHTKKSASVNDMKYLLSMCLLLESDMSIEVRDNLEYKLQLNTNLPKIKYEQGPRIWQPKELRKH